jgi:LysR family transcriptional regulator, regulator for genes of the gallate degradation pathway
LPDRLPSLSHLRVFCEAARRGSLSSAACAAHLSQPAITQAIHAVERAIGAQLLARSSMGVALTAAGAVALPRCERLLLQLAMAPNGPARGQGTRATRATSAITFSQLSALMAVVDHGGFSGAARSRAQARATIHRATRSLERTLALPLFERTSFGIGCTRVAVELARCAALALNEFTQARAEVAALHGGDRGRTVIGAMPLAQSSLVPRTVLEFVAQYPEHRISILDGPYDGMLADLRRGAADLLIGALRFPPPGNDIVQQHLFDDPLALVLRAGHPLRKRLRPGPRQLSRFPWIVARSGAPLRSHFEELFTADGVSPPETVIECNSMVVARALLLGSDCLMLSSAHQVHHELQAGELAVLPHPQGQRLRDIGITLRRDWQPTAAQRVLLDTLRRQARQITV